MEITPDIAAYTRAWTRLVASTRALRRLAAEAARCQSAAVAVEFAIVSVALITTILFIMTVGVILYFNQALDYATSKASRQIMVGTVQGAATSQAAFQSLVCSYLPAAFNCANVIVNVQTLSEAAGPAGYYAFVNANQTRLIMPALTNASAQYSPGLQGSYEYVQVVYPITFIPAILSPFLGTTTYQGAPSFIVISTAAFRNEQY